VNAAITLSRTAIELATLAIDLVADLNDSHVHPLFDRLHNEYYIDEEWVRDAVAYRSSFNIIHLESMMKLDVFVLKPVPYPQAAFAPSRTEKLEEAASSRHHCLASAVGKDGDHGNSKGLSPWGNLRARSCSTGRCGKPARNLRYPSKLNRWLSCAFLMAAMSSALVGRSFSRSSNL
jgi:hypothetical protein